MKDKTNRSKRIFIRVSNAEIEEFQKRCEATGLTRSDYFRIKCLEEKPLKKRLKTSVEKELLGKTLGELNRVGNNVNQIAKRVNRDNEFPNHSTLKEILSEMQVIRASLKQAMGLKDISI